MSVHSINLNTLIQYFALPDNRMRAKVRAAARAYMSVSEREQRHFHIPFWRDAKQHLANIADLQEATRLRVREHAGRARLYPAMAKGFLDWWGEKRRWTNQGIKVVNTPVKGIFSLQGFDAHVKVYNVLSFQVGDNPIKSLYPYFSEKPPLNEDLARIALWVMYQAIPDAHEEQLRILDIHRSKSYSLKRHPLKGDEEKLFYERYQAVNRYWEQFCEEFRKDDAA